jgi:tetratricopeptide (TPR) repeat protein
VISLAPAAALLLAFSPLTAEERNVREGNEKLLAGDPAEALRRYDAAERAVGPRAELDYDRGNALHRLGREAEARDAWRRALERGAGPLSSRALQNMGNALDAMGDREGAVAAFTEALRKDTKNEDARFDLEVLLRRGEAEKSAPQDRGDEAGARKDGRPEPRQGEGAKPAGQERSPGSAPEPGRENKDRQARPDPRDGREREAGASRAPTGDERSGAGARAAPLPHQDAEKLLDALRARERNMPLSGRERSDGRRADAEKDW